MSTKSTAQQLKPLPVFFYGEYLLPVENIKRRWQDDPSIAVIDVRTTSSLINTAKDIEKFIIVYHVTSTSDLHAIVELMKVCQNTLTNQNGQILIISASGFSNIKNILANQSAVEVVANSLDTADLEDRITRKYQSLTSAKERSLRDVPGSENLTLAFASQNGLLDSSLIVVPGEKEKKDLAAVAKSLLPEFAHEVPAVEAKAAKAKTFFPISDRTEAVSLIMECIKYKSLAMVYNEALSSQVTAQFNSFSPETNEVRVSITKGFLSEIVRSSQQRDDILINFDLKRARVFFRSQDYSARSNDLFIKVPEVIFEVQRRANLRLQLFDRQMFANFLADGLWISFQIVDLSVHGICVQVPLEVAKKWRENKNSVKQLAFTIGKKQISIPQVRLAHLKPSLDSEKMAQVGFQFLDTSNRDLCALTIFIYRENISYLDEINSSDE